MQSFRYQYENKCQCQNHSGTGIWRPQSGTGMLRYQTELRDDGMLMPAVSALMPLSNNAYNYIHVFFNNLGFCEKKDKICSFCAKGSTNLIFIYHNHVGFYDLLILCPTLCFVPQCTYRGRGEIGGVYLPSQLECTTTLLVMVDGVTGGGCAPGLG
jgi:hypothetical protein